MVVILAVLFSRDICPECGSTANAGEVAVHIAMIQKVLLSPVRWVVIILEVGRVQAHAQLKK